MSVIRVGDGEYNAKDLEGIVENMRSRQLTIKEYITKSEGSVFFVAALNGKLLEAAGSIQTTYQQVFDNVPLADGQGDTIRFPSYKGINPSWVPELGEFPFTDIAMTSITVTPQKFGMRLGLSKELIDDNQVSLMQRLTEEAGRRMGRIVDEECWKSLDAYGNGTGSTVAAGQLVLGSENRGGYHTSASWTNGTSGSGINYETLINSAITTLQTQTITVNGRTVRYPVVATHIAYHPSQGLSIRKVLNAAITVLATGVGGTPNQLQSTQLAGSNLLNGSLQTLSSPYIHPGNVYVTESRRGLVTVTRKPLSVEESSNFAFDTAELKASIRFMPAVIEQRTVYYIWF